MDGVTIGRDAIVGAGAVAIKDVSALGVAGGVPARVIRVRSDGEPGP
jgi:acetyltransferase-like isoleucine patch superfamily enzyme